MKNRGNNHHNKKNLNKKRSQTREEMNNSKRRQIRNRKIKKEKKLPLKIYENFSLIEVGFVYSLNYCLLIIHPDEFKIVVSIIIPTNIKKISFIFL